MIKVNISYNGKEWNIAEKLGTSLPMVDHITVLKSVQKQANDILTDLVEEKKSDMSEGENEESNEESDENDLKISKKRSLRKNPRRNKKLKLK